jgi:hypothetical protein
MERNLEAASAWMFSSQTQLTLVSKEEDLLGLLEEIPSSEAAILLDVSQRRGVVDPPEDGDLTMRWRKDARQKDP